MSQDKTVLDLMIGHDRPLTDAEKENLLAIVLVARRHNQKDIKELPPGKAIELANRCYESEQYFRQRGVPVPE